MKRLLSKISLIIIIPSVSLFISACATDDTIPISKEENKKIYPASMTKIMTLALAMEYLEPDEVITVSKTAMDATTPNST